MKLYTPYWYTQAYKYLGESAKEELKKALEIGTSTYHMCEAENLDELLHWRDTPQGYEFWENIHYNSEGK